MNQDPQQPWSGAPRLAPEVSAEELAQLAATRPDLWGEIAQHPNTYGDLRQWVSDRLAEQQAAGVAAAEMPEQAGMAPAPAGVAPAPAGMAPAPAPSAPAPGPMAPHPFDSSAPYSAPYTGEQHPGAPQKSSKKGLVVTLSVVGAVIVLAGAGAALWFTGALHTLFGWDTSPEVEVVVAEEIDDVEEETIVESKIETIALPDGFARCPDSTVPLAWAEFGAGWALVCGEDEDTPSFAEVKLPSKSGTFLSEGSDNPTSSAAKTAVAWNDDLGRYIVTLSDATQATLDYEIGTITVRDPVARTTVAQHRLDRYVFMPKGTDVRTTADAAQNAGAFGVQAPTATAEDQVRYMIQVLEIAYQGREIVKQALPKLQACSAGPGGYADTIAQMEALRDNRATVLQALDAMPVDLIPEGQLLLDDLRQGIEYSHQANGEYVAWANAANAQGCAQLSAAGQAAVNASDPPKQRFAERWNRVIVPQFGVRSFDAWYI